MVINPKKSSVPYTILTVSFKRGVSMHNNETCSKVTKEKKKKRKITTLRLGRCKINNRKEKISAMRAFLSALRPREEIPVW